MSHSQFHCTGRVYLDLHGLIFETSICYWQDQPGSPCGRRGSPARGRIRRGARIGARSAVCQTAPGLSLGLRLQLVCALSSPPGQGWLLVRL